MKILKNNAYHSPELSETDSDNNEKNVKYAKEEYRHGETSITGMIRGAIQEADLRNYQVNIPADDISDDIPIYYTDEEEEDYDIEE
ncbi:8726_t:CDS:2 [Funneliformis mosseae]|uniref:8726_t:CDS:1 n=1 Tax=Funneliformis mosseae TaxID=27381 RepID=A0A9N9C0E9_FUNMO|nr:8726_t:CDS:2 [Funneliformis mosseae]